MNYAGLSDAALDEAYRAAVTIGNYSAADAITAEIVTRLASVRSFVGGLFGSQRFPNYEQRLNFSQSGAARESTAKAAQNAASEAGDALKIGLSGAVVVLLLGVAVYAWVKK